MYKAVIPETVGVPPLTLHMTKYKCSDSLWTLVNISLVLILSEDISIDCYEQKSWFDFYSK